MSVSDAVARRLLGIGHATAALRGGGHDDHGHEEHGDEHLDG